MKCSIIALGKKLDAPFETILQDYLKRLPKEWQVQWMLHEGLKPSKSSTQAQIQQKESALIQTLLPKGSFTIALDERGKQFSSQELALQWQNWQENQRELCFIIGGAYGLDADFLKRCNFSWSLSNLTLPHALVRVILAEQIYRTWTILSRHPYHK